MRPQCENDQNFQQRRQATVKTKRAEDPVTTMTHAAQKVSHCGTKTGRGRCSWSLSPGNCGTNGITVENRGEHKEGEEGERETDVKQQQTGSHSSGLLPLPKVSPHYRDLRGFKLASILLDQ